MNTEKREGLKVPFGVEVDLKHLNVVIAADLGWRVVTADDEPAMLLLDPKENPVAQINDLKATLSWFSDDLPDYCGCWDDLRAACAKLTPDERRAYTTSLTGLSLLRVPNRCAAVAPGVVSAECDRDELFYQIVHAPLHERALSYCVARRLVERPGEPASQTVASQTTASQTTARREPSPYLNGEGGREARETGSGVDGGRP